MKQLMASLFSVGLIWLLALQCEIRCAVLDNDSIDFHIVVPGACAMEGDYYYFVVRAQTRSVKHGKSCYSKLVYRIRRLATSNWKSQDIILDSDSRTRHCHLTHNGKEWHCGPNYQPHTICGARLYAVAVSCGPNSFKATLRRAPRSCHEVVLELYDGLSEAKCSSQQCVFTTKIGNQVHELKLLVPDRRTSLVPYPVTGPINSNRQINASLLYSVDIAGRAAICPAQLSFPMRTKREPLIVFPWGAGGALLSYEHTELNRGSPTTRPAISMALTFASPPSSGVSAVLTFVPEGTNVPDDAVVLVIPGEQVTWIHDTTDHTVKVFYGSKYIRAIPLVPLSCLIGRRLSDRGWQAEPSDRLSQVTG